MEKKKGMAKKKGNKKTSRTGPFLLFEFNLYQNFIGHVASLQNGRIAMVMLYV